MFADKYLSLLWIIITGMHWVNWSDQILEGDPMFIMLVMLSGMCAVLYTVQAIRRILSKRKSFQEVSGEVVASLKGGGELNVSDNKVDGDLIIGYGNEDDYRTMQKYHVGVYDPELGRGSRRANVEEDEDDFPEFK